ncbi:hypothetical protein FZI85_05795 [Mycobacterium sp. CBMA293]|uniref:hypothetical protein n=1 Tax=unclassified Mycolicibacterium TaxID=2636767 RepID=UPI0012DF591E|nr:MULTISPECIES: hypothetical protein [unclassified Mycolicibacterium]MUL48792.1 hypothetical protein [Mycolicibacterium sp. CBMA 360]MUL62247.1 hypothetical protein [Mycolicibacterium sp. CBMA 335]MUL71707.1 hypothetical protein [Mycolicibacterium sp. CBMA 311]MUL93662.1 hypothetical protein [Mycolicibacterium sp. CBMA 230]MUM10548.1 hypothetical protein [Mycolicibacterium sp. CBMA 293]
MLPDTTRSIVDESRRAISHYITVATLSLLTCVIALGMGTARLLTVETWLPTVCGAALLAFIAYRSSVAAALTFSDLIRSVVDLQRRRLLAEYHLALPSSPAEERRLWHVLSKHLLGHTSDQDSESVIRYAIRTDLT